MINCKHGIANVASGEAAPRGLWLYKERCCNLREGKSERNPDCLPKFGNFAKN